MSEMIIGRQTSSYRQGLVLGLTMAEIMLLLVFTLLIAVGVALSSERAKRDDALTRLRRAELTAAANQKVVDTIKRNSYLADLVERTAPFALRCARRDQSVWCSRRRCRQSSGCVQQ